MTASLELRFAPDDEDEQATIPRIRAKSSREVCMRASLDARLGYVPSRVALPSRQALVTRISRISRTGVGADWNARLFDLDVEPTLLGERHFVDEAMLEDANRNHVRLSGSRRGFDPATRLQRGSKLRRPSRDGGTTLD